MAEITWASFADGLAQARAKGKPARGDFYTPG